MVKAKQHILMVRNGRGGKEMGIRRSLERRYKPTLGGQGFCGWVFAVLDHRLLFKGMCISVHYYSTP